jgi:hypothetical protein
MLKTKAQTIFIILKQIKMRKQKMSLANMQGKLTRDEMKNIKGGVEEPVGCNNLYSCPKDSEDEPCYGVAAGCTCKHLSDGGYGCRA